MHVRYMSKTMQQFVKFVHPSNLIRQRATLLWFASGFVLDTELCSLLPNAPRFLPNTAHFHGKSTAALYKTAHCDQRAVHTVEEKWCTWRRVFKCRFAALFLTYTVGTYSSEKTLLMYTQYMHSTSIQYIVEWVYFTELNTYSHNMNIVDKLKYLQLILEC